FRPYQKLSQTGWRLPHFGHHRPERTSPLAGVARYRARVLAPAATLLSLQPAASALRGDVRRLGLLERELRRDPVAGHPALAARSILFPRVFWLRQRHRAICRP